MDGREVWRRLKAFVGPQYLVEPPSIEGAFEESQTLIRLLDLRPESALADLFLKVSIGRCHNPYIDGEE